MKIRYEDPEFRLEIYLELLIRFKGSDMTFLCNSLEDISEEFSLHEFIEIREEAVKWFKDRNRAWDFPDETIISTWKSSRINALNRAIEKVTRTITSNIIKEYDRK